jgi:cell division protein FtsX
LALNLPDTILQQSFGVAGELFADFLPIILVILGIGIFIAIFETLTKSSAHNDNDDL